MCIHLLTLTVCQMWCDQIVLNSNNTGKLIIITAFVLNTRGLKIKILSHLSTFRQLVNV